jgi:hypothetical protein
VSVVGLGLVGCNNSLRKRSFVSASSRPLADFLGFLRCKKVLHYWFDWRYIWVLLRSLLSKQNGAILFWSKGPIDGHSAKWQLLWAVSKPNFATEPDSEYALSLGVQHQNSNFSAS